MLACKIDCIFTFSHYNWRFDVAFVDLHQRHYWNRVKPKNILQNGNINNIIIDLNYVVIK